MLDAFSLFRKQSPYFAGCLERFISTNTTSKAIRSLLDAGQVQEALSLALEARNLSGDSQVPEVLLGECYLACDLVDLALPILKKSLEPAFSSQNGPAVYTANQADLVVPLLAMAMTRVEGVDAAVDMTLAEYRNRTIGDRGALGAAVAEENLGERNAARNIYLEILESSDSRPSVIQALRHLFMIIIDEGELDEAASLALQACERSKIPSLFPDSLKLMNSVRSLVEAPSPSKRLDFQSRLLYLLDEREQAMRCVAEYSRVLGEDTSLFEALIDYAWEIEDVNTVDECISYTLDRSLPLDNPQFLSITARRLASRGDIAQAVETFGLALKADPGFRDALRGIDELTLKVEQMESREANPGAKPHGDVESCPSYNHLMNARRHLTRCELPTAKLEALLSMSFGDEFTEEARAIIAECDRHAGLQINLNQVEQRDGDEIPRILIASPVRQKPLILKEFLKGLAGLKTCLNDGHTPNYWTPWVPAMSLDFLFADDNQDLESVKLLRDFNPPSGRVFICPVTPDGVAYHCDDVTHIWSGDLIDKVATVKDFMIEFAIHAGYDYLFLVDSDLVLHPRTLERLLWTGRDIVSEVFWTKWQPEAMELPQVWLKNHYDMAEFAPDEHWDKDEASRRAGRFVASLRVPGTYHVGGLGACTLINVERLRAGLRFRRIANMSLRGEDRDFCVRAAALGHSLSADTSYPPLHLYRDEDLSRVPGFWEDVEKDISRVRLWQPRGIPSKTVIARRTGRGGRLTLSMLVRNEADRYLAEVLTHASGYIDDAVILDDASDDDTVEVCRSALEKAGIPLTIVSNKKPGFSNEIALRKQLWQMTLATEPDWILSLDADEVFEDAMKREIRRLLDQDNIDLLRFRLYDMWDREHYRDDTYWNAHKRYFSLLIRYQPSFPYVWKETPLHCGRLPMNVSYLPSYCSDFRIKHLGWMNPLDRQKKYVRYMEADPDGKHGIPAQYKSILDEKPRLVRWIE